MVERSFEDILNVSIDTNETKVYNAVAANSFQSIGPNGEIIFDSTQQTLPGFIADTASLAFTASTAPAYLPLVGGTITGNLTVSGTAYLNNVISVTSSYSSGSTIFGDALSDTHRFTGSVFITGSSLTWNGSTVIASNVTSSMSVASASQALTASYFNGSVTSASYAATASKITIVNEVSSSATYYPVFANNASGPVALGADAATYTYQPSTNILTVTSSLALRVSGSLTGSLQGTASWATNATFANGATYANQVYVAENVSPGTYSIPVYPDGGYDGNNQLYNASLSYEFATQALTVNNITASNGLFGTSSWATRALTASYVTPYEGAWTSYTPIWTTDGATQPVIGNGSITGAYKQIGKTVFVRVKLNAGSSTTFGAGAFQFSLPVTASSPDGIQFPCSILDNGIHWYQGIVNGTYTGANYKSAIIYPNTSGWSDAVTSTAPFTWGNTDSLQFNGSYESI